MSDALSNGRVITFYSYKGGTGRSMALANVACLLAQRSVSGRGVLMMDWDLEAPGLHRFFQDRFAKQFGLGGGRDRALDFHPGLIDLFVNLETSVAREFAEGEGSDPRALRRLVDDADLDRFILATDIDSLYLMKAGRFDEHYSTNVNTFDWEGLYNRAPELIPYIAKRLSQRFEYVLIDSRTGLTDISGICTMLLPEKLVAVFTPNRQSLTGVLELVERATNYRKQSLDLRPLVVYPLPSRIEMAEPERREAWRSGQPLRGIRGYQELFEQKFRETYSFPGCDLGRYFDEVQIQHQSRYAYGEEIAVLVEQRSDSLSLTRRYSSFVQRLVETNGPWDDPELGSEFATGAVLRSRDRGASPYRGLQPFGKADADFFFGREAVIDGILNGLQREPRFQLVIGPSGSGKTSVIHAGILPRLQKRRVVTGIDRWTSIVLMPAALRNGVLHEIGFSEASADLASAVLSWNDEHGPRSRLVLVIDQLEELFTVCTVDERARFFDEFSRVLQATAPVTVLAAIRDDFYSDLVAAATPELLRWLEQCVYTLPSVLDRDEMLEIIGGPARAAGLILEPGLPETIVQDLERGSAFSQAGIGVPVTMLPVLESVMAQLYEKREADTLTHRAYRAMPVGDHLAIRAEAVYTGLPLDQQPVAKRVFSALVHVGDRLHGVPDTLWRRVISDLWHTQTEKSLTLSVIQRFVDARLLVASGLDTESGQGMLEIIHIALVEEWQLLKRWLEEDWPFLKWRQGLHAAADKWAASAPDAPSRRDIGLLLRTRELAEAEAYIVQRPADLANIEAEFIRTSSRMRRREALRRRVRYAIAVAVATAVVLVGFVVQAVFRTTQTTQQTLLEAQAAQAEAILLAEQQRRVVAESTLNDFRSVQLSAAAAATSALATAEAAQESQATTVALATSVAARTATAVSAVRLTPTPTLVALVPTPWHSFLVMTGHTGGVFSAVFSPDGLRLLSASNDGTAWLWNATTGERQLQLIGHTATVNRAVFSPDARTVATASNDGSVRLWDATTGRTIATGTHKDWVDDVAFSPDGTLVATASRDGTAMIWTSSTLTPVQPPLTGHVGQVLSVAFSPDGSTLATSGTDGSIIEWSVASHQPVSRLSADQLQPVTRIAFSPDGSRLASSQLDGSVVVWDLHGIAPADNGSQQAASAEVSAGASLADRGVFAPPPPPHMTLTGHTGVVYSVAFSPDGRKLVSAGQDTTARVWDAITGDNLAVLKEHDSDVFDAVFGPTGSVILTASNDGTMREWVMDAPVVPPALAPSPTATPTPRPSPL